MRQRQVPLSWTAVPTTRQRTIEYYGKPLEPRVEFHVNPDEETMTNHGTPSPNIEMLPPLVQVLRYLTDYVWTATIRDLAAATSIDRRDLLDLRAGRRPPTVPQWQSLCRACGVKSWRKLLALSLYWTPRPSDARYASHPKFASLRAAVQDYPRRSAKLLHPVDPERPFVVHTFSLTFNRPDVPHYLSKARRWKYEGPLWDALQKLENEGVLRRSRLSGQDYSVTFQTEDDEVPTFAEAGPKNKANVTLQLCPWPSQFAGNPAMSVCRFYVVDAYHASSPVRRLFQLFVGQDPEDLSVTRFDLACGLDEPMASFDFHRPPARYPRRWRKDVLISYLGCQAIVQDVLYDNAKRGGGGTRFERRYGSSLKLTPKKLLDQLLDHSPPLLQWDLRLADVPPSLQRFVTQAQSEGVRVFLERQFRAPDVLRKQLVVHNDPNNPSRLLTRAVVAEELRRLADHLGVAPSFFGLRSRGGRP